MPQGMGRDIVDVGALFDVFIDHSADASCCDASALIIQENGLFIAFDRRAVVQERWPRNGQIMHQGMQSVFVKRHDPLLLALSGDTDHPLAKINITHVDHHKLADTYAGRVQELYDRAVSSAEVGVRIGSFNESDCVLHRKMIRQFCLDTWGCHKLCGVYIKLSFPDQKLKKRPQAGKLSRN